MKNVFWAVAGLVILIVVLFLFSSKQLGQKDTLIPTPNPVESPGLAFLKQKESTQSTKVNDTTTPFTVLPKEEIKDKKVRIKTAKGDIVFVLFEDAPIAASNFISLVNKGFYNGLTFHRREENFVIQGGDPKGDGTGGPGYRFADEPVTRDYKRGTVAMANAGPNTNGSQFFIMLADAPLPKQYTIFGQVTSGLEIVDKIKVGDKMDKVTVE